MAKPKAFCPVPGCKGVLEPGKKDGITVEWCRACERRISQLQALHDARTQTTPAPAAKEIDEARLMKLVQARCWNLSQCAKHTRRGMNLIRHAIRSGALPSARIGRYSIVPKAAAEAWGKAYKRRSPGEARMKAAIAELPRSAAEAITVPQWAKRAKRSEQTLAAWTRNHRADARLKRVPVFSEQDRPTIAYWWQEATNA